MSEDRHVEALLAEFRDKAEPVGVTVERVTSVSDVAPTLSSWAREVASDSITLESEIIVALPGLGEELAAAGFTVLAAGQPSEVRDAPFGVSLARLAIAESGSVLHAEPSLADRSVGMLTLAHATVCPTRAVVASLDGAIPELRRLAKAPGGSFTTLVTGPSRTADIERVLTVGVQGPGKVMTLFVDEL
jgi:L-lactate dehydrogenase complex protein LldG